MNMIEKVARAIFKAFPEAILKHENKKLDQKNWDELNEVGRQIGFDIAKAAIQAMREPTEEMSRMATLNISMDANENAVYTAYIDAALKE